MSGATEPERICAQLIAEIGRLGFGVDDAPSLPDCERAERSRSRDPYSGGMAETLSWRDQHGRPLGRLIVHEDGSFYAEYDVLRPHPADRRWFVEGVIAWGKGEVLKSEPKLLPAFAD